MFIYMASYEIGTHMKRVWVILSTLHVQNITFFLLYDSEFQMQERVWVIFVFSNFLCMERKNHALEHLLRQSFAWGLPSSIYPQDQRVHKESPRGTRASSCSSGTNSLFPSIAVTEHSITPANEIWKITLTRKKLKNKTINPIIWHLTAGKDDSWLCNLATSQRSSLPLSFAISLIFLHIAEQKQWRYVCMYVVRTLQVHIFICSKKITAQALHQMASFQASSRVMWPQQTTYQSCSLGEWI